MFPNVKSAVAGPINSTISPADTVPPAPVIVGTVPDIAQVNVQSVVEVFKSTTVKTVDAVADAYAFATDPVQLAGTVTVAPRALETNPMI
jgi:hypothetical protein